MKCIANGACFENPYTRAWVVGDLYATDEGSWVLNANINRETGEPAWIEEECPRDLTFSSEEWWERRGIFVFDNEVDVSAALADYIGDSEDF